MKRPAFLLLAITTVALCGAVCACSSGAEVPFRPTPASVPDSGSEVPIADAVAAATPDAAVSSDAGQPLGCAPFSAWTSSLPLAGLSGELRQLRVASNGLVAAWFDASGALRVAERAAIAEPFGAATLFHVQPVVADASISLSATGLELVVASPTAVAKIYARASLATSFDPATNSNATVRDLPITLGAGESLRDVAMRGAVGAYLARVSGPGGLAVGILSAPSNRSGGQLPFQFLPLALEGGAPLSADERISFAPGSTVVVITATATSARAWRLDMDNQRLIFEAAFPYGDLSVAADGCSLGYGTQAGAAVQLGRIAN